MQKIKQTRHNLIQWNKNEFRHVPTKIKELTTKLHLVQQGLATVHSNEDIHALVTQEHLIRMELNEWLNKEEIMWAQCSKQMWLLNGDRNTTYFHTLVKQRKAKNTVTRLELNPNRIWIDNYSDLKTTAREFFSSIFKLDGEHNPSNNFS